MSSSRRAAISMSVFALAIAGLWVLTTDAQDAQPAATAQVLVVKRAGRAETPPQFQEDYMATQSAMLKSHALAQRAVERGKLDELLKLEQSQAITTVLQALAVKRHPADSSMANVITLSIYNHPKPVAVKMLTAIIESYQMLLDELYLDYHQSELDALRRAQLDVERRVSSAEKEFEQFLKSEAPVSVQNPDRLSQRLTQVNSRLAEIDVSLTELNAQIKYYEKQADANDAPAALKSRIEQWAMKSGLDKSQATIPQYVAGLKLDLALQQQIKSNLESLADLTIKERSAIKFLERRENHLRTALDTARSTHDSFEKRIQESSARKDTGGYRVVVVVMPH